MGKQLKVIFDDEQAKNELLLKARDLRKIQFNQMYIVKRFDTERKRTEQSVDYGKRHVKEARRGCNNLSRQSIATMEEDRANINYNPKLIGGHKMTPTSDVLSNVSSFNCYYTNAQSNYIKSY